MGKAPLGKAPMRQGSRIYLSGGAVFADKGMEPISETVIPWPFLGEVLFLQGVPDFPKQQVTLSNP